MQFLVVAGLGAVMFLLTRAPTKRQETVGEQDAAALFEQTHKDNREAGVSTGTWRHMDINIANLNEAHKPYSAPRQEPTHNVDDIFEDQSSRNVYASVHAPGFFFRDNTEIPLTSAAAGVYNIELPSYKSFRGDHTASLAHLPRSYVDYTNPSDSRDYLFAGDKGSEGASGANEPETWEERHVPPTGQLNFDMNPFGPGGGYQRLFNNQNEQVTRERGVNRAVIIGPPRFKPT